MQDDDFFGIYGDEQFIPAEVLAQLIFRVNSIFPFKHPSQSLLQLNDRGRVTEHWNSWVETEFNALGSNTKDYKILRCPKCDLNKEVFNFYQRETGACINTQNVIYLVNESFASFLFTAFTGQEYPITNKRSRKFYFHSLVVTASTANGPLINPATKNDNQFLTIPNYVELKMGVNVKQKIEILKRYGFIRRNITFCTSCKSGC